MAKTYGTIAGLEGDSKIQDERKRMQDLCDAKLDTLNQFLTQMWISHATRRATVNLLNIYLYVSPTGNRIDGRPFGGTLDEIQAMVTRCKERLEAIAAPYQISRVELFRPKMAFFSCLGFEGDAVVVRFGLRE